MKKSLKKIMYIVFIFCISSLIGSLIEILYQIVMRGSFKVGGFLYGPFRPIYGLGSLLLYFIGKKFNKNIFTIFISSLIICSMFEYLSSVILELVFNRLWWDYSSFFLNINGRICLSICICWGILGLIFTKFLEPILHKIYDKLNKKALLLILIVILVIFSIDTTFSIMKHLIH